VGNTTLMRQRSECCIVAGRHVIIGVAGAGQEIASAHSAGHGPRVWKGTGFRRRTRPDHVPKIVTGTSRRRSEIDALVTHTLPLERINEAFDLMHSASRSERSVTF